MSKDQDGVPPAVPQADDDWRSMTLGELSDQWRREAYGPDSAVSATELLKALSAAGGSDIVILCHMVPVPGVLDTDTGIPQYYRPTTQHYHGSSVAMLGMLERAQMALRARVSQDDPNPLEEAKQLGDILRDMCGSSDH